MCVCVSSRKSVRRAVAAPWITKLSKVSEAMHFYAFYNDFTTFPRYGAMFVMYFSAPSRYMALCSNRSISETASSICTCDTQLKSLYYTI